MGELFFSPKESSLVVIVIIKAMLLMSEILKIDIERYKGKVKMIPKFQY